MPLRLRERLIDLFEGRQAAMHEFIVHGPVGRRFAHSQEELEFHVQRSGCGVTRIALERFLALDHRLLKVALLVPDFRLVISSFGRQEVADQGDDRREGDHAEGDSHSLIKTQGTS
jgi:hypothetical protein